jgi:predicted DNA-binding protein
MSNTITIELCAEDRARLDRLAAALETRTTPADPIQEQLAAVIANASTPTECPTEATEEPKAEAAPTIQPEEEAPTEAEETTPAEAPKPTVTLEQIQQKVVQLAAGFGGSKKAKVREIINAYAKKVTDLPEDKWAEVWAQLTAMESEG